MARGRTIRDIAEEIGADNDEVLVTLWDAGIDDVDDPEDVIPNRRLSDVRKALGIVSHKERLTVSYWLARTQLDLESLIKTLADVGIRMSPRARRLPKGALRKLTKLYPDQPVEASQPPEQEEQDDEEPLRWEAIGIQKETRFLTETEIAAIHTALEIDFAHSADPIVPLGIRDRNLLASAVSRGATAFGGDRKYPTLEMASAALFHSLIHNHPFFNGNKRTALVSLLAQLDENDLVLTASEEDLFRFTLRTAQHKLVAERTERPDREVLEIARWVKSKSRQVERGERPMPWRKLRQRLRDWGCTCEPSSGVGNRLNITRVIPRSRRLGLSRKPRELSTQVAWSGDGTDADKGTIHKIRRDLELDDDHDVDSATFYAGAKVDAFIIDYRRILRRLAKL